MLLTSLPQNSSLPWCTPPAVGQEPVEGENDEEREEERDEEEKEEEEEEKKVDLSHSSATLLPDLLEFERCEEPSGMVLCSHGETLWGREQTLQLACVAAHTCMIQPGFQITDLQDFPVGRTLTETAQGLGKHCESYICMANIVSI